MSGAILVDVQAVQAENARLLAEIAALKAARQGKLTLKVSDKGAISVYGMGRWPVTLYRGQMERLLEAAPQIRAFITANADALAVKD